MEAGHDVSHIQVVASFFISRVDAALDATLPDHLKGKIAIALAKAAYQDWRNTSAAANCRTCRKGANRVQLLWASTGVKDPSLPDTLYVTGLVAPNTVNTMPEATLNAVADHGEVTGNTIVPNYSESNNVLDAISVHVSYPEVVEKLEVEGLSKFDVSWGRAAADRPRGTRAG